MNKRDPSVLLLPMRVAVAVAGAALPVLLTPISPTSAAPATHLQTASSGVDVTFLARPRAPVSIGTICAEQPDGSPPLRVVKPRAPYVDYAWSPTGRLIAVTRLVRHQRVIEVMRPDGTHSRRLAAAAAFSLTGQPSWSPNGKTVAFVIHASLFVSDWNGAHKHQLTNFERAPHNLFDGTPSWSPDSARIYFIRTSLGPVVPSLMSIPPTGGRPRLEAIRTDAAVGTWSQDRQRFALVDHSFTDYGRLLVENADGSDRREVAGPAPYPAESPAWSPDGQKIAFLRRPKRPDVIESSGAKIPPADVFVVDLTTGRETRLTETPTDEALPQWRPSEGKTFGPCPSS